jgi:hypothetical protein
MKLPPAFFIVPFCAAIALFNSSANAMPAPAGSFAIETVTIAGSRAPGTPEQFNRVGYNRYAARRNGPAPVLILVSGYISGAGYFDRMARSLAGRGAIEVWTLNRRETFLENRERLHGDIDDFIRHPRRRSAVLERMNCIDRYLVAGGRCVAHWGLRVQMEDLRQVVRRAQAISPAVFLGGWSDGGEFLMAYTHFRFDDGRAGYEDLAGLVFLDVDQEWAVYNCDAERIGAIMRRHTDALERGSIFVNRRPSLAVYNLAIELARRHPEGRSPLTGQFNLPQRIRSRGITNLALAGWLFDQSAGVRGGRGPFSYFIRSGELSGVARGRARRASGPVRWKSHQATGEVTDIRSFLAAESAPGRVFEFFYPRRLVHDFWAIARCGFDCPELSVRPNPDNTLPVFNAQTRAHWSPSILPPILTWYLGRNGMGASSVTNIHLPCYTHADLFFAADAERELYAPLEGWIARASALSRGRESAASR